MLLLRMGWGMDMEAGRTPGRPGIMRPPTGTMPTGWGGREDRARGSPMLPKPRGMGLTRSWLRVGGTGWLSWNGLAWAAGAGAEPVERRRG